jgi:hypothetical protein
VDDDSEKGGGLADRLSALTHDLDQRIVDDALGVVRRGAVTPRVAGQIRTDGPVMADAPDKPARAWFLRWI